MEDGNRTLDICLYSKSELKTGFSRCPTWDNIKGIEVLMDEEEADKVSARIAALLSERAFSFTPNEYFSVHRKLFTAIYSHAGCIRDYNITKKEWVLDGATVADSCIRRGQHPNNGSLFHQVSANAGL